MTKELFCSTCGKKFYAKRISAKYCSESCKQIAKRNRAIGLPESQMLNDFMAISGQLLELKEQYITDGHSPDMQLEVYEALDSIRFVSDKISAILSSIESEQSNSWYQCQECGQRTFGKVKKCDFCGSGDFKRIAV